MQLSAHPLWLVGFRPFFSLACLSGLALPVLWALIFAGSLAAPAAPVSAVQWHAHEMFFGFGWAVLGGFLLTATKNWVGVRGWHGNALIFLEAAWLFERAGMWFGGAWPPVLFRLSSNLFLASIVAMLLWTLIRNRKGDSYRDNYFFLVILPAFMVAKYLMPSADHMQAGGSMALGLLSLCQWRNVMSKEAEEALEAMDEKIEAQASAVDESEWAHPEPDEPIQLTPEKTESKHDAG